ncbi:unnamed protein product [Dracunculus medinensis]|uniref:Piwi domain-containing protein n=1 Tax=Dracunculus medinensis TaxID=318479 RepID=A0A0N4UHS2_DRAME|nr:unnamed protein product [Dracunculus medinensis]
MFNCEISSKNEIESCEMAKKLAPAVGKRNILITTNLFPLEIENLTVFRYDVQLFTIKKSGEKRDICRGERDDYSMTVRHRKCMLLVRLAFELYNLISDSAAYLYDMSNTIFTNQPIYDCSSDMTISHGQMDTELKKLMENTNLVRVSIKPCTEYAHSFNIRDYQTSIDRDLSKQDRSLRQFFEILTNNYALQRVLNFRNTHYAFGCGKLFIVDGKKYGLRSERLSDGRILISGADKGLRFVQYSENNSIVPALALDAKYAIFFDDIPLIEMLESITKSSPIPPMNESRFLNVVLIKWIAGLRLKHCNGETFVASGLSDKPVEKIKFSLENTKRNIYKKRSQKNLEYSISMLEFYEKQGFMVRGDLPSVYVKKGKNLSYFPIELLYVLPRQRVPIKKHNSSQIKESIEICAVLPDRRFSDISKNLKALNLHEKCRYNPYMEAFGTRVNNFPIEVIGHRRDLPQIFYSSKMEKKILTEVDDINANWRLAGQYLVPAKLNNWYILYDDGREAEAVKNFTKLLIAECHKKGLILNEPTIENIQFEKLEPFIKMIKEDVKNSHVFIMYIDSRNDTHDNLKLFEVLYRIITQHIQLSRVYDCAKRSLVLENIVNKLNCKNFGQCYGIIPESFALNKWISHGKTLIIGYDVCHPDSLSKYQLRLGMKPTEPSVLGISFNGATYAETFIGDYAFQEPRKEQVTGSILEERIYWILNMFILNRGVVPNLIIITRDGVSEGQFKMVMQEEINSIRSGIENFRTQRGINSCTPKIVCIITCKRHNRRFAIEKDGKLENCPPLTVIDRDVTRADVTEFYMQSHKIIKGTGKMPSYTIPINEANLTMDEAQSLMMALCFTHQIVNQSISIPEPIYQADEWAKRGRNNFRAMVRRCNGKLPLLVNGDVDWQKVTKKLCFMHSGLEGTRINA